MLQPNSPTHQQTHLLRISVALTVRGFSRVAPPKDYVICEVLSETAAECIDRAPTRGRSLPEPDTQDNDLEVTDVSIEGGWTTVTFLKPKAPLDDQDYDLGKVCATDSPVGCHEENGELTLQHTVSPLCSCASDWYPSCTSIHAMFVKSNVLGLNN